ncbi:hypothetical protein EB118_10010 [bacterium]|nr:hypothetical protein [bacterium]
MPSVTKANPTLANTSRSFLGKTLQGYTIDLAVNATDFSSTEMGAEGAVQAVMREIAQTATIVAHSALRSDGVNAGQVFDVIVEGEFGTDIYDGSNSETFAADLEDRIQALTSVGAGSVNLSSATVTAMTGFPYYANSPV